MATNEIPVLQIDNNSSGINQNHNIHDIPLYAESQITRKQAIHEIADVVVRSNMKPRTVKHTLQLLQKLLPSENTLPTTTSELFGAMMSSENDWRLAQYLIKYKQCPSFLPSSSNISITSDSSLLLEHEQESNSSVQPISLCAPLNHNELSSNSDDENNLTPYQRLQQCLRPITEVARNFPLTVADNISLTDHRFELASNSMNSPTLLESLKHLIDETSSMNEREIFNRRIFYDDNEISSYPTMNENNKFCCFEINGYNLLNNGE